MDPERTEPEEPSPLEPLDLAGDGWLAIVRAAEKPRAGGRLGTFEILEEVRHGGQGLVFRARQSGTGRVVALKRLASGTWSTPAARRRFEREIELVVGLCHPGIVVVHGVEVVDGVPCLAMEWVDGEPLTASAARCPPGRAGTMAKVRTFVQVCEAVQHAHQSGVIHRDLKPTNVLVDRDGRTRVLDFGLARRVPIGERSDTTRTLGFLGTPSYAAPEHFTSEEAPIDVRSDVYSLGVMLYECLAGRRPFRAERLRDLIEEIERREPERLSSFTADVDRELETIVAKSLAKAPAERYQTVHALREDLQRYLDGEPVQAMPPSTLYQARKWIRRNRLAFGFSLALGGLSLGFGLVGSWQATVIAAERAEVLLQKDRADDARDAALASLAKAEERGREAARALAQVEEEARRARRVQEFYVEMVYTAASPTSPSHVETVDELIAQAVSRAREFFAGDLDIAVEIEAQAARSYVLDGRLDEGRALAQGAMELLESLPDPPLRFRARLHAILGELEYFSSRWPEALRHLRTATDLFESLPSGDSYSSYAISALHSLAVLEIGAEDLDGAESHLRRALALLEQEAGLGPYDESYSLVAELGGVLSLTGRFEEAEELLMSSLEREESDARAGAVELGKLFGALGQLYLDWGKAEKSVPFLERSLESLRVELPEEHWFLLQHQYLLGMSLHATGRCAAALEAFARVLALGSDEHLTAAALAGQANCEAGRGRLESAAQLYRSAYDALQPFVSAGKTSRLDVLIEWQDVLVHLERMEEAEALLPRLFQDLRMCAPEGQHPREPHLAKLRAVARALGYESEMEQVLAETGAVVKAADSGNVPAAAK